MTPFVEQGIECIKECMTREFTAVQLRAHIEEYAGSGREQAPTSNSWGTLFRAAAGAGIIKRTDKTVPSARPEAHNRRIPVWRKTK